MGKMNRIRVMLVDDHDMVRQGLAIFIETVEDLELVAQASNGAEAVQICDRVMPDVILMDLMMPEMDGLEATQAILAAHPDIRVVALTSFKDKKLVQSALQAGAMSYMLKNATIDELADVIRSAHAGRPVLSAEATQVLIDMAANPPQDYNLTERELEVLQWLAKGLTNRQIGERMYLSRFTVKSYVSDILSKLDASSRSEAVALALQNNLIE